MYITSAVLNAYPPGLGQLSGSSKTAEVMYILGGHWALGLGMGLGTRSGHVAFANSQGSITNQKHKPTKPNENFNKKPIKSINTKKRNKQ